MDESWRPLKHTRDEVNGSNVAMNMMKNMGFVEGGGLGKNRQGRATAVTLDASTSRAGFGHGHRKDTAIDLNAEYDDSAEEKPITETVTFIECSESIRERAREELCSDWIVPTTTLRNETHFCEAETVNGVIEAKAVFDSMNDRDIREARKRANPYETIMGAIFQNRAAMKTANLDRVLDWRLSRESDEERRKRKNPLVKHEKRENTTRDDEMFYFADVCAGPGGFSEYMIWRKGFYNVKGFGFTLRGNDDFKLRLFRAGSAAFFETYYGVHNDGDVTKPENLECDGGFSVQGKEEIQEILSNQIYLCQFIVGLSLCRVSDGTEGSGGNFLCKLFDVFTPFSAGLCYLMYLAFDRITLHKPHTSRPANSERLVPIKDSEHLFFSYIFCENLTPFGADVIRKYFVEVNNKMDTLKKTKDVVEVYPVDKIKNDVVFYDFAIRQIIYLDKYRQFTRNKGIFDHDQMDLREKCLEYWEVPDAQRNKNDVEDRGKPGNLALRSILKNQQFDYDRVHKFILNGDAWKEEGKQIRLIEQCAVLMPEYTPPTLLFSNEQGRSFIYRFDGQCHELSDLLLPPNTLLLVQETQVYKKDEKGKDLVVDRTYSNVIFIVDAALINGDDISRFDYGSRIRSIRKFCIAINRGVESIKADSAPRMDFNQNNRRAPYHPKPRASFYFHCAEPVKLEDLPGCFDRYTVTFVAQKCLHMAVREFRYPVELGAPDESLFWTCKAVRFAQLYKPNVICCWSNSMGKPFLHDLSGKQTTYEFLPEFFASFYDHIPLSSNVNNRPIVWMWKWQVDSKTDYGPKKILTDDEHSQFLTVRALTKAIEERRAKYDPRVFIQNSYCF
ncbi:Cap-specific mRNA (nucleoside-2'-O-)-methyltransferase 1 [Aphelenchoides besseyi]|nr:Cap-specific mRNA (nucleoside-2'-O-)-methyltransferase 1 [Aphelenchoides besseyi]